MWDPDVESFEVAPGQVVHGAVGEWDVIFLDLSDNFDAIATLELDRDDEIKTRTHQLGNQHRVSVKGGDCNLDNETRVRAIYNYRLKQSATPHTIVSCAKIDKALRSVLGNILDSSVTSPDLVIQRTLDKLMFTDVRIVRLALLTSLLLRMMRIEGVIRRG